jgi:hypothetical protein
MKQFVLAVCENKYDSLHASVDTRYQHIVHTLALRSRLLSEQPIFTIKQLEHSLSRQEEAKKSTYMPFVVENLDQSIRETKSELSESRALRSEIEKHLSFVTDEHTLLDALDAIQSFRFNGVIGDDVAPHRLESWVPSQTREQARKELEKLSRPREDLAVVTYKILEQAEITFLKKQNDKGANNPDTWAGKRYKQHMLWLADDQAQAKHKKIVLNIIDLTLTLTALAAGVSGSMQRQIEGTPIVRGDINALIQDINADRPWEVAADLATPKARSYQGF